jgi:sugar O-acyltransferase (sialic acid O-acetyltransferase NeuD family)
MKVIVVGAGSFGLEIATYLLDLARAGAPVQLAGFLDDTPGRIADMPGPAAHLGPVAAYVPREGESLVIALGDAVARHRLYRQLHQRGAAFYTLVHPLAYVAADARLGSGTIVAPFAFVGPKAQVAENCAINVHACVGHDVTLEASVTISPQAVLNGFAFVGEAAFVGANATLVPKARLGAYSKLAAGSVLYAATAEGVLARGNPAESRQMFRRPG